jgi:hypothetical protein
MIGVSWFILVDNVLLRTNNHIRNVMMKLNIKNTLSDDTFYMMTYKYENEPEFYKKLVEIDRKKEELSKIKQQLKGFTENMKNLEFIKEMERAKKSE